MAKPTPNDLILDQVNKIIHGQSSVMYDKTPGMCLAVTRQVIEKALKKPSHWLYDRYIHDWVQPEGYDRAEGHWARDFERSAKLLGWAVSLRDRKPGDIVFNWKAAYSARWGAYIGHVGILIDNDLVFENIDPKYRQHSFQRHALAITPLNHFPTTLVARVPKSAL